MRNDLPSPVLYITGYKPQWLDLINTLNQGSQKNTAMLKRDQVMGHYSAFHIQCQIATFAEMGSIEVMDL